MAAPAHIARENGKKGGRPKGSGTIKPFRDYVSEEERAKFVEFILDSYMGDMRLAQWFGNQLFGQAPQSIDHTTKGEKMVVPLLDRGLSKNDSTGEDTQAK